LVVPFAQSNTTYDLTQLANLTVTGNVPLNRTINEAIGDFLDQKRFEGANRWILMITGSDDTVCRARPERGDPREADRPGSES
jgi:hypothetical protein